MSYSLSRQYTGQTTDTLTLDVLGGSDDRYSFSLYSESAYSNIEQDKLLPLASQTISLSYASEGVHFADFKVQKASGQPYIFEILTWEYSTEIPDVPIISFDRPATNSLANNLLISDSRTPNTTGIWIQGDVSSAGKSEVVDGGYWDELKLTDKAARISLTPGDGPKVVNGKFRNIFGTESALASPAEIILKQTPPSGCDAELLTPTIGNNKVSIKMAVKDPYQTTYSVTGDVRSVVDQRVFADGEIVFVYVSPNPGKKNLVVFINDIAGNTCLAKDLVVTLDPNFASERIDVVGHPYWSDTENVTLDVFFDHFADQEPLQLKITGDVSGPNTNAWIAYQTGIAVTFNPTASGRRRVFAQYKDAKGVESYLITTAVFLKPTITLVDAGAPFKNVVVSNISDTATVTISGCAETYANVAYQAAFLCQPNVPTVSVAYLFQDGSTLTRSTP